jgi:Cu2+-exporting ATPase
LALDPSQSSAILTYRGENGDAASFLSRLADAAADGGNELEDDLLPSWPEGEAITLYRNLEVISLLEILSSGGGCLLAHHPAIARDPAIARRIENIARIVPGVIEATATGAKAELRVRFNTRVVTTRSLVRLVETELCRLGDRLAATPPGEVDFAPANVSLGLAATSEFVLPVVTPVTAAMLVFSNVETFRETAHQARAGKCGRPLLYSSIVGVTLATGQFLSAALMVWFFRYWEHRYRQDLAVENQSLLEQTVSLPNEVRVLTDLGEACMVPRGTVTTGQRARVLAGEAVAFDAFVIDGAALVDEAVLRGTKAPVRRVAGDQILAGSKLIAGTLDLEVLRSGDETQAARIARSLIDTTVPPRRSRALNRDAEEFADKAVTPTFFAAGAGLLVGDLTTAGAILSPDYATGVGLAAPLETLRDVKLAIRNGAVVRAGNAFARLAAASWIVLEDNEALGDAECGVSEIRTNRLDEKQALLAAAAAGVWLGDERGPALARACRERGFIVRRADLREIDAHGVVAEHRGHVVRLHGRSIRKADPPPALRVEFDGAELAVIHFRRSERLTAAGAVRRLQLSGLRVFLASARAAGATARLASQLGVDQHCGDMCLEDTIRLLRQLRQNGVAAVFVGDCEAGARASREAHLAIALVQGEAVGSEPSDIALLGRSIEPLPVLFALARNHTRRIERAHHSVMAPNLLCVAAAFSLGLSSLATVFVTNFGTSMVYSRAMRSLRASDGPVARWSDSAWDGDDRPVGGAALASSNGFEIRNAS